MVNERSASATVAGTASGCGRLQLFKGILGSDVRSYRTDEQKSTVVDSNPVVMNAGMKKQRGAVENEISLSKREFSRQNTAASSIYFPIFD